MNVGAGKSKKRQRGKSGNTDDIDNQGILEGFKLSYTKVSRNLSDKHKNKLQKENNNITINDISSELDKNATIEPNILTRFDLDYAFGPCSEISRKERLERAKLFGVKINKDLENIIISGKFGSESIIDKLMNNRSS
ncbi:hypothetical protein FG379_000783 [Cryptosporidium bovis]|uniref:uncharacterized protein n=1 Tax=Cryptosporidium bovis TaxID=310047 RepID=UPI003519E22C|nr:hypothetical protein FG379_000783 [Cryptosporidium bovis]